MIHLENKHNLARTFQVHRKEVDLHSFWFEVIYKSVSELHHIGFPSLPSIVDDGVGFSTEYSVD